MPKHSILIAAYNRLDYLWNTVISCLSSVEDDFEIIINDDASSDSNADIFYERLSCLDKRLFIRRNESNEGVGTRFYELHDMACGEILHVIGSDDLMHPHRLSIAESDLETRGAESSIWCSQVSFHDSVYNKLGSSDIPLANTVLKAYLFLSPLVMHPSISYYNNALSGLKPYKKGMRAAIDYNFYVDNFHNSDFVVSAKKLTKLVYSSHGITRNKDSRKNQLENHDLVMYKLWSQYIECSLDDIKLLRAVAVTSEDRTEVNHAFNQSERERVKSLLSELVRGLIDPSYQSIHKDVNFNNSIGCILSDIFDALTKQLNV